MESSRSEAATDTDMDTGGAITAVAVITTVGAAAITMAGTEAITTVGAIITAIGGDVLTGKERPQQPAAFFMSTIALRSPGC